MRSNYSTIEVEAEEIEYIIEISHSIYLRFLLYYITFTNYICLNGMKIPCQVSISVPYSLIYLFRLRKKGWNSKREPKDDIEIQC